MFRSTLLVLNFLVFLCWSEHLIYNDLENNDHTNWKDFLSNQSLEICQNDASTKVIGKKISLTNINWQKIYSLPSSNRLDIYIEYQVSGVWNKEQLQVFANDYLAYSQEITLTDQIRLCNTNFQYSNYMYFTIIANIDNLKITIKSQATNVGLYIQKLIIDQRRQYGRNNIIPFISFIKTCSSGFTFEKYYCKCPQNEVFQHNQCQSSCDQNYVYDTNTESCIIIQNFDSIEGKCNEGYYMLKNECLEKCPIDYYSNTITMNCENLSDHLTLNQNKGNPVNHYFFYKNTAQFFHFFKYNDFYLEIISVPQRQKEKTITFINNKFVAGSYEAFQAQNLTFQVKVTKTQYKLLFRAIAHFIDFQPSKANVYINQDLQPQISLIPSTFNEGKPDQDYIAYYDYYWTRSNSFNLFFDIIKFQIEQPLQNGAYQGFFYVDEIHLFQYQCMKNCQTCFSAGTCTPCLNPANKDPATCLCLLGYYLFADKCIACPTYCESCQIENICDSCVPTTLRINPPACITCPSQYFVHSNIDNCQSCMIGCYSCTSAHLCNNCLSGYYKNKIAQCVTQCSDGYFNDGSDISNPLCNLCDINCLKCQDLGTTCTDCKAGATLINNKCYSCNDGQFLSGINCLPCTINNCKICTSTQCQLCADSYFMQSSIQQCIGLCNTNQFSNVITKTCDLCHQSCATCAGSTSNDCVTCQTGLILNLLNPASGQCIPNCLSGYFIWGTVCAKCWIGCSSCMDFSQACLQCAKGYYRYKINGLCYQQCPIGYYNNKVGYVCTSCNPQCLSCNGPNEFNCLSCTSPLTLYQNQCQTQCPEKYGNIGNICKSCTANCKQCFGTAPNQCSVCGIGFYFLRSQCFVKCPQFFIGIRPQYVCKCIYENCVQCTDTQYFYNNQCYDPCPPGTYGYNGLCVKCDLICDTCFGEGSDQCLSCQSPLVLFKNNCIKECTGNTFHDLTLNECLYCDNSCLACNGPNNNNCIACYGQQLLEIDYTCGDECSSDSYLVQSERKCYHCDVTCKSCFGGAINNCLTCFNLFYLFQCVDTCPDGFEISSNLISCVPKAAIIISQCSYQCVDCQLTARFCMNCSGNRVNNPPSCDCQNGYYDDGSNPMCIQCSNKCSTCSIYPDGCITCKGDRLLPKCECPKYYYDNSISVYCIKCQDNCATCSETGCLTCLNDRINAPDCICPDGYFDSFQPYCSECAKKCQTCQSSSKICSTCASIRLDPPICFCPPGYFENSDEDCQKCNPTCLECNQFGCLSCAGNRIGPNDGFCQCSNHGVSRLSIGSVYCTDCKTGVPYFGLNDEFNGFSYTFGGQVALIGEFNCSDIFEIESLNKLGTNPQCDIDFNVIFGDNPKIQVGDSLKLKSLKFHLLGCDQNFDNVLVAPLSIPPYIDTTKYRPLIEFNDVSSSNVCNENIIYFKRKLFNGRQPFKVISWNILLPTNPNPVLNEILQANVGNNSEVIIFPIMSLEPIIQYRFEIKIESFAKLTNTIQIEMLPNKKSTIYFEVLSKQNQYHRFDDIKLSLAIKYVNCIDKTQQLQTLFYQVKFKNQILVNSNITQGLLDGYQYEFPLQFNSYFFNFSNPNTLILTTNLITAEYSEITNNTFDIFVLPSIPLINIIGGNRMIGYTDKLELNASIIDQDYTYEEKQLLSYQCIWECTDIVNGTACQDSNNLTLTLDNNCYQLFNSKSFSPYKVFNFQATIYKNDVPYSSKVSIQFIEIDLPQLTVDNVDVSKQYNYYDEFIFKINYPGINPDLLMYAGAVVYDSYTRATFEFYYLEFKFKLENYFTNLDLGKGRGIRLRLSVYNPHYIMPSISTIIMPMNIPPQNCQINHFDKENIVEFLDILHLEVINCQDHNYPLLYSAYIYPNQTIYHSDLIQSHFYNKILIVPPQQSNILSFTLPYFTDIPILIVFQIQDSLDGIVNITTSFQVKLYQNLNKDNFINLINQKTNFDDQLINYRLLAERLSRMNALEDYKETLFQELIFTDQNQTLFSNQTESLYHTISIMAGQNQSLFQINQTHLFQQIKYRTTQAAQKLAEFNNLQTNSILNSQLNIEKINYIQQYYTFVNIYSSLIKFRVAKNQTSQEVQQSLSKIMTYLQDISIPNEPLYAVKSYSANLNFGYLTTKLVNQITGSTINTSQQGNSTTFYKFSETRYIDNPYYAAAGFPKNSSGYQAIDPKISTIDSNISQLNSPMSLSFPTTNKPAQNTSRKCITEVKAGEWNANFCKSIQQEGQVICQCNQISPTSIMDSLDYILDKAEQIYSLDTLLAFLSFPFYKTIIFYFYLTITISYLAIVFWGMRVDSKLIAKISQERDLAAVQGQQRGEFDDHSKKDSEDPPKEQYRSPLTIFSKNKILEQNQESQIKDHHPFVKIKNQSSAPQIKDSQLLHQLKTHKAYPDFQEQIIHYEQTPSLHQIRDGQDSQSVKLHQKAEVQSKPKFIFPTFLKQFHQILSIIYKDDEKKPRGLRATIIYTSIMGSLVVLFVFNEPNNLSLTISLALITAPLNKIYQILLEKMLSHTKKIVRSIGAILMIIIAGVISYTMLAGLVLSDSVETTNKWSYIFLGSLALDNIFYSPIQLAIQYYIHIGKIPIPVLQQLLNKLLDEESKHFIHDLIEKIK